MSRLREWLLKILLRKEVQTMAVVYATLIVKGKKTLEQVPAKLREEVEDILEALESRSNRPVQRGRSRIGGGLLRIKTLKIVSSKRRYRP